MYPHCSLSNYYLLNCLLLFFVMISVKEFNADRDFCITWYEVVPRLSHKLPVTCPCPSTILFHLISSVMDKTWYSLQPFLPSNPYNYLKSTSYFSRNLVCRVRVTFWRKTNVFTLTSDPTCSNPVFTPKAHFLRASSSWFFEALSCLFCTLSVAPNLLLPARQRKQSSL